MRGASSKYWERAKVHRGFWWRNLRERDHLEHPGVDGRIILKWIFKKWYGRHGLLWLRIETAAGPL